MTRSLGTNFDTALSSSGFKPFFAVDLGFDSGNVRLWTGYKNITIDSNTFVGGGGVMTIGTIDETGEIRANGVSIHLSGLNSSLLSAILNEDYQNRGIILYFGTLDSAGAINDTPYIVFRGQMDVMSIQENGDTSNIVVQSESRLIDLDVPRERRYTKADQQLDFPNDKGLNYVASLQEKAIVWGG